MDDTWKKFGRRDFLKASSLAATSGLLLGPEAIASTLEKDVVPDVIYF